LTFPDEYRFTEAFTKLIKTIDNSSADATTKKQKADLLFKTNKAVLENRVSKFKLSDIKQAMDDLYNKYKD
tara:strand:+ start:1200 stop:1412 length:213 start_codon:yes stop_codon:yes gene_type:complete